MNFQELKQSIDREDWPGVVQAAQGLLLQEDRDEESAGRRSRRSVDLPEDLMQRLIPALLTALLEGDFQVRWTVAKLLPSLGEATILPLLELLKLEDGDPDVQWFIVRMLGSWQDPSVVETLIQVLCGGHPELQSMAMSVLVQQGNAVVARLEPLLEDVQNRPKVLKILAGIRSRETIDLLLSAAKDEDPSIRALVIEALSSFQDARSGPIYLQAIQDPHSNVRLAAVQALGFCKTLDRSQILPAVIPLLWDLNLPVCCSAAVSLGRLSGPESVTALTKALFSQPLPEALGIELVRSLVRIGSVLAIDALSRYLIETPILPSVQTEILTVLGRVENPQAKPLAIRSLLNYLTTSPNRRTRTPLEQSQRIRAVTSLGQLGDRTTIPPLISQLADPNPSLRLHILRALQTIDPALSLTALRTYSPASDPNLQAGIQYAIAEWR